MPEEAQVNLRADLTHEIATAQSALEGQLATLEQAGLATGDSALLDELRSQLKILTALSGALPHATGGKLIQIRTEVATSVAVSRSIAGQAQASLASARAHEAELAALHEASAEARKATEDFLHDYYERRIFDEYLHFDTIEDEQAYHAREAERLRAINAARAENTPEGDLRASKLTLDQLNDAGEHGATASPEFRGLLSKQKAAAAALEDALAPTRPSKAENPADAVVQPEPSHATPVDPSIMAVLRDAGVVLGDPH